jgi:hypothetical protein
MNFISVTLNSLLVVCSGAVIFFVVTRLMPRRQLQRI